jgi:hypothetical protein
VHLPAIATPQQRLRLALGALLVLHLVSTAPRLLLYGAAAFPSSLLRVGLLLVEVGILVGLTLPAVSLHKRTVGATLLLIACVGATLLEGWLESRWPGSMYPAVLYRVAPSSALVFVSVVTDTVLRVGLWTLLYEYPLKLDEARRKAHEAAELERARDLAKLRELVEPTRARRTLREIGASVEQDPNRARERLAAFADGLDATLHPNDGIGERPSRRDPKREASLATPTVRAPVARRQFGLAVAVIGSLFAVNSIARAAEHGLASIRLDFVALVRIGAELLCFWVIAERAAKRSVPISKTIGLALLVSITLGLLAALFTILVEATFPGLLFPPSVFTHPTPPVRLLVRAVTTAFVDVAFFTLVYLHPLASAETAERAAHATRLLREAELAGLRATLAPHFVRNALNVIAGLVATEPEEARRLLEGLAELLEELEREEEEHSLAREVSWLRAYAALLEARHPDRLAISFRSDPSTEGVMVPRLLLQPLLENAVIHGALAREEGGQVQVIIERERANIGAVTCTVVDNGPGIRRDHRTGLGTRLVRERLATRAAGGRLTYFSSSDGTRASLVLPEASAS